MDDDDDHPFLVELNSLRETAARFQHEAHTAAIKLQRHSLEASRIHEHAAALEQENARLSHEIDILRAHPDAPQHPAVVQVQELSLALRRVSEKITLTENTLLERTTELAHTRSELTRARHTADDAHELTAQMRAREEASKARERELELRARASEEERKMVDLVVQEYADLVRNLEGRKCAHHTPATANGSASAPSPTNTLQDAKSNLHRMLTTFSTESEKLHATIAELNAKVSNLQTTLEAERKAASHDRTLLSETKTQVDKLNLEDQSAAKMVARYMKFSQASTNALQQQITTLRTRHASMVSTLELQLSIAESQFASERAQTIRLHDALDELCEDLTRESYGRRREVALRLALLAREESIAEFIRRWARRARELYLRCYNSSEPDSPGDVQEAFRRVVADAESLLSSLDDDVHFSDGPSASGTMTRITLAMAAVDALKDELQDEMRKRIEAIRKTVVALPNGRATGMVSVTKDPTPLENASSKSGAAPDQLLLTPNGNVRLEHEGSLVESPQAQDATSPVSMVGKSEKTMDDPIVVSAAIISPVSKTTEGIVVQETPSPSLQSSALTLVTVLVEQEPKVVQPHSPAVSMLDLREETLSPPSEEPPATDVAPIPTLPSDTSTSDAQIQDEQVIPSASISTSMPPQAVLDPQETLHPSCTEHLTRDMSPIHTSRSDILALGVLPLTDDHDGVIPSSSVSASILATSRATLDPPSPASPLPTLLSELGATKHRYVALQWAFRDCSVALKELKRTLASSSPSPHTHSKLRQHLETALARIDDYAEDARVELEIRVADDELTVRGFEMVLSVPGALADAGERAEVEAGAWAFVNGTGEGVANTLDKFGKKLEDVQHDVAVVKRAVHGLTMQGVEDEGDESVDESMDAGAGWTAWTAGLLGANTTPSRSPTPVQTFGTVMTSPRLRHAASLKQLRGQENAPDRGPLEGLNLRIPMPSPSTQLGLGRGMEETRPRTLSAMYAVGGLRSSSIGLGVGLGRSPSPARPRGMSGPGMMGMGSASLAFRTGGVKASDTRDAKELDGELGGVE